MSLPEPYYHDEKSGITIYHADCRDILPFLPKVDLVLTDPPYGIADKWVSGSEKHGWRKSNKTKDQRNEWDAAAPSRELLSSVAEKGSKVILWGGNYFELPPSRGWLVWSKPERNFSLADAELAWTNQDANVRVFDGPRSDQGRIHPTQKPVRLMTWCINWAKDAQTILDPFMGSGTTLVAAKQLGKKAIGIEIEEEYCKIAVERLAQEVLPL